MCSFILMLLSDCVKWHMFLMLKVLGNFRVLFNIVFRCSAILYLGLSFQLTSRRMGNILMIY
jgi:hypothetical protein